jgi:hypothetical protein
MSIRNANNESVDGTTGKIADVANPPTSISAANVGTARAYNNGSATVSFTGDTSYWAPTSYTATSSPGDFTASGASSPLTVTGLQSATAYTFTVKANNSAGASAASAASSSITATTVPQAPTIGTFTDGGTGTTGTLSFTAGATGGSTITGYKFSTDGTTYTSASGTTSPLSLTGLTVGTYNFSLKATNTNGDSAASGNVSGEVIDPNAFVSIATLTGTGTAASLAFTSIPSTYKHLQIRFCIRGFDTSSRDNDDLRIRFNSDTTNANYYGHFLQGNGSTVAAVAESGAYAGGQVVISQTIPGSGATANVMATGIIDIIDYASTTKNKTVRFITGNDRNGSGQIRLGSVGYFSTSAISSIQLLPDPDGFTTTSVFSLYGIKG